MLYYYSLMVFYIISAIKTMETNKSHLGELKIIEATSLPRKVAYFIFFGG